MLNVKNKAHHAEGMAKSHTSNSKPEIRKEIISFEEIYSNDLSVNIFRNFNRHQVVNRCWRKNNGKWLLQSNPFTEEWGESDIEYLVAMLKITSQKGGIIIGAFLNDNVIGFASVENELFGPAQEYIQLSNLHVSFEHRGKGIGKNLFKMACIAAKTLGAKKLYLSSHSSEETQAFYKSLQCKEAIYYNPRLVMEEPFDCQLEYEL